MFREHTLITMTESKELFQHSELQSGSLAEIKSAERDATSSHGLETAPWVLFEHFWGLSGVCAYPETEDIFAAGQAKMLRADKGC